MIGPEHDAGEQRAADQPRRLGNHAYHQRYRQPDGNDPWQPGLEPVYGEPVQSERLRVKYNLQ